MGRELLHLGVVEAAALRREQHAARRAAGRELAHGAQPGRRRHHHAAATAVGLVVDDAMGIVGEAAQVAHLHLQLAALPRAADEAGLQELPEELGEDGHDADPHASINPSGRSQRMRRPATSTSAR